jgi:hypothetical protein
MVNSSHAPTTGVVPVPQWYAGTSYINTEETQEPLGSCNTSDPRTHEDST